MKKLLSKKAFTLVEVLIATAITGLLIAAVMALFGPVRGLIKSLDEDVRTNNITDTINTYMYDRLKNSSAYNIGLFTTDECLQGETDDKSVAWRLNKIMNEASSTSVNTTYCMMIRYDDDDTNGSKGYRIYDFGDISKASDIVDKMKNYTNYELFKEEFYNNKNFQFTFETIDPKDANDYRKWCKFEVTAYDQDGLLAVEPRSQMFKLVNMSKSSTVGSAPELAAEGYDKTKSIVIIYRLSDYTTFVPEAE